MTRKNSFAVLSVDQNGPWTEIDGVTCLRTSVNDAEMVEDFENGFIKEGDMALAFSAYWETPDHIKTASMAGENGWAQFAYVRGFVVQHGHASKWVSVYLHLIREVSVVESP